MRVHELAKELKLTSKELLNKLKPLKISAKNHMSVLENDEVKTIRQSLKKSVAPSSVKNGPSPAASTPSLESVKREFMIQRLAAKPAPNVSQTVRKTETPSTPPRPRLPIPEIKKMVKPAAPHGHERSKIPAVSPAAPSPAAAEEPVRIKKLILDGPITVKDLAVKISARPNDLIQKLIKMNILASINQSISFEVAAKAAQEFGYETEKSQAGQEAQPESRPEAKKDKSRLKSRAPIVTLMGHVDHGKTSLLDAIRKTKVAAQEAGGITQHIGAYEVFLPKGAVTFLDTPGHEAFTAMRARGARATDVVVLVVAADDGVMPQTVEAIHHAKAAEVPIIVAVNKIDLPSANFDRVKKALMEHGLTSEDWGGKTIMLGVSAKTGKGIDELLEMLALESDLLELRADPDAPAEGVVIEAELSKESGVLATVLVQDGTLHVGDTVIVGHHYCRVRAMINDRGQRVKEALPSMPVEILGLSGVPKAGDRFHVTKDERSAKETTEQKQLELKEKGIGRSHMTLEHLFEEVKAGKVEELKLIIKSDVQGSVEALQNTLGGIPAKNVRLNIIHSAVGDVTDSDVMLAAASDAVIIGFHVDMMPAVRELANEEGVDVRFYDIIYEAKTSIEKAMEGLLEPEKKEVFVGVAEVRQVFKVSKAGMIAGCSVQKGKIVRNYLCRVIRGGKKIHEGKVASLKRFKDDAREVLEGYECGIGVSNFEELIIGDRIEAYEIQEKARKLE